MNNIITVSSLKKSYGKIEVVKGISFEVEKGTLFAFLGPNGAGKSTTIDIISTIKSFDSGEINIAGFDLSKNEESVRKCIGIVFQDSVLDETLTVRENLEIRASFYYRKSREINNAVNLSLTYTEISDIAHRKYGTLSGGQRRRVDIARALLNTPEILVLDEPTTGLDPQNRKHIWKTIQNLQNKHNMTIFLTTHYMEEASNADYVVIINEGQIVAKGTPNDLKINHSYDRLLVKPKEDSKNEIFNFLNNNKYTWRVQNEIVEIKIDSSMKSIEILNIIKEYIDSFEVLHGDMDDVFLNITGRELKE